VDKGKLIKIAIAVILLITAIIIIVSQLTGGTPPDENTLPRL